VCKGSVSECGGRQAELNANKGPPAWGKIMEREIKFRGWHTKAKKMFSAEEMAADQLTLLPTGAFINVNSLNVRLSEIYPPDKFVPLQFTGHKDENGKEIYEGDVVRAEVEQTIGENAIAIGTVEWCYDNHWSIDFGSESLELNAPIEIEVIGNIYENPELVQ
jgi:uncharacterized phage protein (TIGR01671 family)